MIQAYPWGHDGRHSLRHVAGVRSNRLWPLGHGGTRDLILKAGIIIVNTNSPQTGLAVCRSIITSHGGTIWAEADEEPGAKILFALPI